jgi:F-type H+-transporting ATPase subunit delta
LKLSKHSRRGAKELFRGCLVNGVLDENRARQTVKLVVEKKPRGYVQILTHFQRLIKLEIERRTARVESAVPFSEDLQASVRANLSRIYGHGLNISFSENPALVGGLRIKVGSDVYDGSVQARLNALKESF